MVLMCNDVVCVCVRVCQMAPELMDVHVGARYSSSCDVFSFGVVLCEIATRSRAVDLPRSDVSTVFLALCGLASLACALYIPIGLVRLRTACVCLCACVRDVVMTRVHRWLLVVVVVGEFIPGHGGGCAGCCANDCAGRVRRPECYARPRLPQECHIGSREKVLRCDPSEAVSSM
jgi:serine/threonine protein kinase